MMLVSNPGLRGNTVTIPVTTMQVATILKALGRVWYLLGTRMVALCNATAYITGQHYK
ncbi:MAG TPA: hypothetical protein VN946_16795 [Terriglobales bacterium]|nr:hypothetical protein [Terriglobales bacterium]